ncbi:MAG: 16S rRNA (uracil(1498)-N(3))-methyltransferase [Lachnospiraceae bacterium]|nr:16S rRNA (uracil(1498)-N(3))-methyltransferase [Lachnospiraceae bacterium]
MYQFFVNEDAIRGLDAVITGSDVNHIKNVLRMKVGDEIALSNGADGKEYHVGITEFKEDAVICKVRFVKEDGAELPSRIYLFQGLPKADKMELIIQKAVELGAYEVVPVAMERCVVKLDEKKAKKKQERWQAIAEAAAKQSKRGIIPKVTSVMSYREALNYAEKQADIRLLPYELAKGMGETRKILEAITPGESIAFFVGPEGGFETEEVEMAVENGFRTITLGKRILRTETAGMTMLSILGYLLEQEEKS